jgi:ABC-type nitrate/sulfonate/bicarbonate transport system permease component
MRREILTQELNSVNRSYFWRVLLLTIGSLAIWYMLSREPLRFFLTSPEDVLEAGRFLFMSGDIRLDIFFSVLEIFLGLIVCVLLGVLTYKFLCAENFFSRFLHSVLPLTYISMVVVCLLGILILPQAPSWPVPLFHQRVLFIALLTFYPFIQALWGLRDQPFVVRVLLALDDALPLAFIVMALSEVFGATFGIGFMMIVTGATSQAEKGLVGVALALILLIAFSNILRGCARKSFTKRSAGLVPAEV